MGINILAQLEQWKIHFTATVLLHLHVTNKEMMNLVIEKRQGKGKSKMESVVDNTKTSFVSVHSIDDSAPYFLLRE